MADDEDLEDEPPKTEEVEVREDAQLPLFPLFLRRIGIAERPLILCSPTTNTYSEKSDK